MDFAVRVGAAAFHQNLIVGSPCAFDVYWQQAWPAPRMRSGAPIRNDAEHEHDCAQQEGNQLQDAVIAIASIRPWPAALRRPAPPPR